MHSRTRSVANSTGFSYAPISGAYIEESVKPIQSGDPGTLRRSLDDNLHQRIDFLIRKVMSGYVVDGLIRQSVDKFAELHKDFKLIGNERQRKYLEARLNQLSLYSGEHWKTTLNRSVHEFYKTGNAMLFKYRGGAVAGVKRPMFKNRPYCLTALKLVSASRLEPFLGEDRVFGGWKLKEISNPDNRLRKRLLLNQSQPLKGDSVMTLTDPTDPAVFIPNVDVLHIMYCQPADSEWGLGLPFAALEDIGILRSYEQNAALIGKKFSSPLIHWKVQRAFNNVGSMQPDINYARSLVMKGGQDGVYITPDNHEIDVKGFESQALRLEGQLDYFSSRSLASMGMSPYTLGMKTVTVGAAEGSYRLLLTKAKASQATFARAVEFWLFNEILWEGGFDPFTKEEDQVHLLFVDSDPSEQIKVKNAMADLFAKGLVDHDYALRESSIFEKQNPSKMYHVLVQTPLIKAEAEAKGEAQRDAGVAIAKARPKPSTKKVSQSQLRSILPHEASQIEDFMLLLEALTNFKPTNPEAFQEVVEGLIEDPEAILEFVQQIIEENNGLT